MTKEHSGGEPAYGFDVGEWSDESFAVPITQTPIHLDTIDDLVRDEIKAGRSVKSLLVAVAQELSRDEGAKLLCRALPMILEARDAKLFVHQILWAGGMTEKSGPDLARAHGITKQAFLQGALRIAERLGMRKTRTMRDEEARLKMSATNHRNEKA